MSMSTHEYVGSVPAQIFIGLGGVGGRILTDFYDRLYGNQHWVRVRAGSTGFIAIDTNITDLDRIRTKPNIATLHTAREDRLERLSRMLREDHFLNSFIPSGYEPRDTGMGAGQIRIESRLGSYIYSDEILQIIETEIHRIIDESNRYFRRDNRIDIFIMGSIAGGTGSGCFLPVAYLARKVAADTGLQPRVHANLITSKCLVTIQRELEDYVHGNVYAALKELETLTKLNTDDTKEIEFVYRQPNNPHEPITKVKSAPFDWISLSDQPKGAILDRKEIESTVADTIFATQMTLISAANEGPQDNYTRFMARTYEKNAITQLNSDGNYTFTHAYATQGIAALITPTKSIKEYFIKLATAQILTKFLSNRQKLDILPQKISASRPETVITLEAKQWLDSIEKEIINEEKQEKELIESIKNVMNSVDDNIDFSGFWTQVKRKTFGKHEELDSNASVGPAIEGEEAETDTENHNAFQSSYDKLHQWMHKEFMSLHLNYDTETVQNLTTADEVIMVGNRGLSDLQRKMDKGLKRVLGKIQMGAPLEDLKLDPQTEKYLIFSMLYGTDPEYLIEKKLTEYNLPDTISNGSLAEGFDKLIRDLYKKNEPTGFISWLGSDILESLDGAHNRTYNQEWATPVQNAIEAKAKYAMYTALHTLLLSRAKTYNSLSKVANIYSDELIEQAQEYLTAPLKNFETYTLEVEALEPFEHNRLWKAYWDFEVYPNISAVLEDPEKVAQLIQPIFLKEERYARSKEKDISPTQVVVQVIDALSGRISEVIENFTGSEMNLVQSLTWEALYEHISRDEKQANKMEALKELQVIKGDQQHADYNSVKTIIEDYLVAKLTELKNKCYVLNHLNKSNIELAVPSYKGFIYMTSKKIYDSLKPYPRVLRVLENSLEGQGAQNTTDNANRAKFLDDNSIVLFKIEGCLPITTFDHVDEFHESYEFVMNSPTKPHALHSQGNWEDTLQNISIVGIQEEIRQSSYARIDQLIEKALKTGVLYYNEGWFISLTDLEPQLITKSLDSIVSATRSWIINRDLETEITREVGGRSEDRNKLNESFKVINHTLLQRKVDNRLNEVSKDFVDLRNRLQNLLDSTI